MQPVTRPICPIPPSHFVWMMVLCLFAPSLLAAPQAQKNPQKPAPGGYRIAGTVVSKTDAHPLNRARVTIRDAKDQQKFEFVTTAEDGKFEFTGLPAGKYSLEAAKRGFIVARYDQHDQFSTAIVTGAGLDTESLLLKLAPNAIISGKVLDEFGEPVRHATVAVYYNDHSSGVDQIHQIRSAQTNDLGAYEITPLRPGIYFLSATATPWYAVHPPSEIRQPLSNSQPADSSAELDQPSDEPPAVDRSLNVSYPVTYYPDVESTDDAAPIPIQGGERVEADFHLNPIPSLRLLFRVPDTGNHEFLVPQLQQPAFDGFTSIQGSSTQRVAPGLMEVTGIPAGRYNVRLYTNSSNLEMEGVDLTNDGEQIDTTKGEAASEVKFHVQIPGEPSPPSSLSIGLRAGNRGVSVSDAVDSKGEAEVEQVAAGRYEVEIWGGGKLYSISRMSAQGAEVAGRTLTVAPGSSPTVSLTLVSGSVEVEGVAKKAGKGFAGAMVVLVPKNPEVDHDLFRRDQSDLDGTFTLRAVVPGAYTLVAIENGWDLDWSKPAVIAAYAKHGRSVEVGSGREHSMNVAEPVEVQSK
jgi:uncharacterized surface anchored protein